jgi:parallel beta-helix repeat protein
LDFGVGVGPYDGITIKNGTIEGCLIGVDISNSDNSTIELLNIRNLDVWNPDTNVYGIGTYCCEDLIIRDCKIELNPVVHHEAIVNYHSYNIIDNIEVIGGAVGINLCPEFDPRDNGVVMNSTFTGKALTGILDLYSSGILIQNNKFFDCQSSIFCEPGYPGAVSGIIMEDNEIFNNTVGVYLTGAIESIIRNNYIHHNDMWGIGLMPWGAEEDLEVYSKDNIITGNHVVWNGVDLAHCDSCTGNHWKGNKFYTKNGAEIPDPILGKATAQKGLPFIDSAAETIAPDAQLLYVSSMECDTTGKSYQWTYIYTSVDQQREFECWYYDLQVVTYDTVTIPWMISENNAPITGSWMNSDSVVTVANGMGGNEFIAEFDLLNIEMSLHSSVGDDQLFWNVHYVAQDTIYSVSFSESK